MPETTETPLMRVYVIYDAKASAYMQPFLCKNDLLAIRGFERAAMNPEQTMHTHPADFTLFAIAEFDEYAGEIIPFDANENIINGLHLPMWQGQEK